MRAECGQDGERTDIDNVPVNSRGRFDLPVPSFPRWETPSHCSLSWGCRSYLDTGLILQDLMDPEKVIYHISLSDSYLFSWSTQWQPELTGER